MVPVWARQGKARMFGGTGEFVVGALDNEFRPGEVVMAARMVRIKVGTDQHMNIARSESQSCELVNDRSRFQNATARWTVK